MSEAQCVIDLEPIAAALAAWSIAWIAVTFIKSVK